MMDSVKHALWVWAHAHVITYKIEKACMSCMQKLHEQVLHEQVLVSCNAIHNVKSGNKLLNLRLDLIEAREFESGVINKL